MRQFVLEGEDPKVVLAPGSVRRRALDAALTDVKAKLKVPSIEWRQEYSLMLGLERVLSDDEPKLADGTTLNAHQGRCALGHADRAAGSRASQRAQQRGQRAQRRGRAARGG